MKQSSKPKPGKRQQNTPAGHDRETPSTWPHWAIPSLCVLLATLGTWAFFEFVVWNRLPPELVGKWVVVEPFDQDGATFDFFRSGSLKAHLNNKGNEMIVEAGVAVEDKVLLTTTRNPNTGRDETRKSVIRELTQDSLIVEFNFTKVKSIWKMVRAQ